jgi:long-chain acyl-CoA synthetase
VVPDGLALPELSTAWTFRGLISELAARCDHPILAILHGDSVRYHPAAELAELSLALGSGLLRSGVAPGEPVVLVAPNSFEWVAARLAVGALGAVAVALVPEGCPGVVGWRSLLGPSTERLPEVDPDLPAMMVYTSGTTGRPKRFLLSSRQISANIRPLLTSGIITPEDRVLLPLPLHHAYPLIVGLLTALEAGAAIVLPESVTGPAILQALKSARVTIMVGVPRLYAALLAGLEAAVAPRGRMATWTLEIVLFFCVWMRRYTGWSPGRTIFRRLRRHMGPDLRLLVSGGARLNPELAWKLEGLGWSVRSGYGLAETASVFTANLPGSERLGSEGRALGEGRVRIGHPEKDGSGEIELRGPCVFKAYLGNPEANAAAFTSDGWFKTGDVGRLDQDGFLYVTGRTNELLVLGGGKKVWPEEIERTYAAGRFVGEIAVLERGGGLVALIVPNLAAIRESGAARPADAIRIVLAELSAELPPYARISGFALTRQPLPRTRLGKYRRFMLPELYERALAHAEPQEAGPLNLEDRALLAEPTASALWSMLVSRFPHTTIALDSSLQLDLGFDSLSWMALTLEIENRLGVRLDEAAVNRILTVRDLLRETAAARASGSPSSLLAEADLPWLQPRGLSLRAVGATVHLLNRLVFRFAFRLEVRGAEHIPAIGPCIIAPNHTSYLDPPTVAAALPWHALRRVHWAGDRLLLFSNPLTRFLCRVMSIFPVDQRSPSAALASAVRVLRQRHMLVWFPEGWRSPDGSLLPFQPGIAQILEDSGASVVPAHIRGAFECLPRGRSLPRFRKITVYFGQPIVATELRVAILVYHRFGPIVTDSMTVTTAHFESQLQSLEARGYTVIPLRDLLRRLAGEPVALPLRAVVLTADDGHRSVYTDMFPLIQRYRMPVTLFIYPSAISNAPYALTWRQLEEMKASGLVEVQSHTYWHPNFRTERQRLSPEAFVDFVQHQLLWSKQAIEKHLGGKVDLLAWPFGIYDPELMRAAGAAGYVAALSIGRRPATLAESVMALPRYIVSDHDRGAAFAYLLSDPVETKPSPGY